MKIIAISALPLWVMGDRKGLPTIYNGVKGFVDAGHEVHFISPLLHMWRRDVDGEFGRRPKEELYDGIHVHRFNIPFLPLLRKLSLMKSSKRRMLRYAQRLIEFFSQVVMWASFTMSSLLLALRVAKGGKPHVVYAHNGLAAAAAFILAKIYRAPNVTRIYGTFLPQIKWSPEQLMMYFPEVLGFTIPCSYLIVTNDGTQGDKIADRLRVPKSRLKFWVNGVDKGMCEPGVTVAQAKSRIGISPDKKLILSLNRLDRWKGIDKLIRAVPAIITGYPNALVLIVGDGGERNNLERLSGELKLENWVRFEGAVPHASVKDYMHAADVFVSTQDLTNFGNHLLEAMTCGKCIVTLNNGDTGNFITHNETGILLEPDALELLPSTIVALLQDDGLRKRLGDNARRFAQRTFQTWDERTKTEVALIENLVKVESLHG
jgi:glycosyltransferase involved in cell wall biosynthesis